jgi:predicted PurR-regulated permease PerM
MSSKKPFDRLDYIYKVLVVTALLIAAAILASDLVVPLAFAAFLAIVMLPIVKKLEKRGLGTALSITIVLVGTVIIMSLLMWIVIDQIVGLVNDLPNLQAKLVLFIGEASGTLEQDFGISISEQNKFVGEFVRTVGTYLGSVLISTTNTLSVLVQIPIYIFLILIYRDKFKEFFLSLLPHDNEFTWKTDMERVVQGYISGLTWVTLIIAALNSIGLLALGIDHAIFFGILSGVLTIIPYVGIIIGALFPLIMALITKDSIWYAIGVIIVFSVVQFLEGNFITPKITGSKVSINALAAIVALVIGSKILGIAGMILSIPAIGVLKIVLSHSEHLKPFVILLEDKDPVPSKRVIVNPTSDVGEEQKIQEKTVGEKIESD